MSVEIKTSEPTKELLDRGYAQTMEEWWLLLNHHWNNIVQLANHFGCSFSVGRLDVYHQEGDALGIYRELIKIWSDLPDGPIIHEFVGFGPLCDLCSVFPWDRKESDCD